MPTPSSSSSETLKKLTDRGYDITLAEDYIHWAKTGADICDIKGVLWRMMELDHQLGTIAREAIKKWPATDDLTLLADLQTQAVEEVLATLKANQCKCG
jgi:hypothetical protein